MKKKKKQDAKCNENGKLNETKKRETTSRWNRDNSLKTTEIQMMKLNQAWKGRNKKETYDIHIYIFLNFFWNSKLNFICTLFGYQNFIKNALKYDDKRRSKNKKK